jgi:hypothetical protein
VTTRKFPDAAVDAAMKAHRTEKGRWCITYDDVSKKYFISRRVGSGECTYETIDRLGMFSSEDACREVRDTAREVAAMRAALEAAEQLSGHLHQCGSCGSYEEELTASLSLGEDGIGSFLCAECIAKVEAAEGT